MNIQNSCLCVSLLASLWVGGTAPAMADPLSVREVELALPPAPVSAIPLNAAALSGQLCKETLSRKKRIIVVCDAIVKNGTTGQGSAPGSLPLLVSAEPLMTPCGLWDATLTLDSSSNLHLLNRKTGRSASFALRHGPGPAAPWVLVPTNLSILTGENDKGEEDEVLRFEGCIPSWVFENPELEVVVQGDCEACPEDDQTGD